MLVSNASLPENKNFEGRFVTILPLHSSHYNDLWQAVGMQKEGWKYMLSPTCNTLEEFIKFLESLQNNATNKSYVVFANNKMAGFVSIINIDIEHSRAEIGRIIFNTSFQKTPVSSESIYLMMKHALEECKFRRLEWRCNSLNNSSIQSANRYGFLFEGRLRNHFISKGASRDTLIFSLLAEEWENVKIGFEKWLSSSNFAVDGKQKYSLQNLIKNL